MLGLRDLDPPTLVTLLQEFECARPRQALFDDAFSVSLVTSDNKNEGDCFMNEVLFHSHTLATTFRFQIVKVSNTSQDVYLF